MEKVIIRTKNAEKLSEAAKAALEKILEQPDAETTVFRALYALDEVVADLNLNLAGEEKEIFASELRYQFANLFPDVPRTIEVTQGVIFNSESSPAFRVIRDKLTAFTAYRILDKILEFAYLELKDIERTGYLLRFKPFFQENSTEAFLDKVERNNFGGLRSLFKNREGGVDESRAIAKWLKDYVSDVSLLFDEVMVLKYPSYNSPKETAETEPVIQTSTSVVVKVAKEASPEDQVHTDEIPTVLEATDASDNEGAAELTYQQVVENADLITTFILTKAKLMTAGITPEMIESKKEKIMDLLNSLNNF